MFRRPPKPTLFPYPTLFRSQAVRGRGRARHLARVRPAALRVAPPRHARAPARSEEHTSELQSRQYLVCRLLLEKKTKTHHSNHLSRIFTYPPPSLPGHESTS